MEVIIILLQDIVDMIIAVIHIRSIVCSMWKWGEAGQGRAGEGGRSDFLYIGSLYFGIFILWDFILWDFIDISVYILFVCMCGYENGSMIGLSWVSFVRLDFAALCYYPSK